MPPHQRPNGLEQRLDALTEQLANVVQLLHTQAEAAQRRPEANPRRRDAPPEHDHDITSSDDEATIDNPFATSPPRNNHRGDDPRRWESGFRLDLPEFNGGMEPDEFLDWLIAVVDILDFKAVPDEHRVSLVSCRLRGRAAAWWHQFKAMRLRRGKSKIVQWEKFVKHLRAEFLPYNYSRILYQKFQNLRQGTRTVDAYTEEFYQLLSRTDISESPDQLVSRYIGGLRLPFQDVLNLLAPITVSEAHQRAVLLERQFNRRPTGPFAPSSSRTHPSVPLPEQRSSAARASPAPLSSRQSAQMGASGPPRPGPCFSCGEFGHRQASCPRSGGTRGLFIDEGDSSDYSHPPIFDDDNSGNVPEEDLLGDVGTALVLRRTCLAPRQEDINQQRHTLFSSTCTIQGKICRFIIDSGSCENVMAQDVVDKLALPTEAHPHPYNLAWLQSGSNIPVTRRVLVQFSVGANYNDSTWCDVVPMDACHLLLGRPWQFDRDVAHNGRKNTYSFSFEGRRFVLWPSVPAPTIPSPSPKGPVSLLSQRDFMLELSDSSGVFLLLARETTKVSTVPPMISSLLQEFADIFPSELPAVLPPLRDIQHQIDLIPGAQLPNRPHYRMSPAEHEELRRQVEDLLRKGHVRESLSPCAVPALLIPKKTGEWRMCVDS